MSLFKKRTGSQTMKYQLNPHIETLFLLVNAGWGKEQKKEAIKQLDELGVNGVAFYKANFPLIERYHAAFASHMVKTHGGELLKDMCSELIYLLVVILLQHPQWLDDFDAVFDEDVLTTVREGITELLEAEGEIIDALEASGHSDLAKWQISALLQQPRQRLAVVFDAIKLNLPAFEFACSKLETDIASLLAQLEEQLKKDELPPIFYQPLLLNSKVEIIPSMAAALGLMVFEGFCIYGLLANRLFTGNDGSLTREEAVLAAKALSDASKLEILFALKDNSLYNLEIAQVLGLTPATTSHHMGMLLAAGLVEVSKREGKVYYNLSTDGIRRYRDWLDGNLLQGEATR